MKQGGFLGLVTVGNEARQQMDHEIVGTAMAGVLNLTHILELVVDGFDQRPFAQEQLVAQVHQPIVHVFA